MVNASMPSAQILEAANEPCACFEKRFFFFTEAKTDDTVAARRV